MILAARNSLNGGIAIFLITGVWAAVALGSALDGVPLYDKEGRESILQLRIDSLKVQDTDMEEALRVLRRKDYTRILIGFEKAPYREGEEKKNVSLQVANTTAGEILKKLCETDPRYTYEVIDNILINVFPKGAKGDPNSLLNMRVSRFSVHGSYTTGGVITTINELAPELRDYLSKKTQAYYAQRGVFPGSPGSIIQGNMPTEFHLELKNLTVREILNAIVLYSLKLYQERPPDATGWRTPPPVGSTNSLSNPMPQPD